MKSLSTTILSGCLAVLAMLPPPALAQEVAGSASRQVLPDESGAGTAPPDLATSGQGGARSAQLEPALQPAPAVGATAGVDEAARPPAMGESREPELAQATEEVFAESLEEHGEQRDSAAADEALEQAIDPAIAEAIDSAVVLAADSHRPALPCHAPSTVHNDATDFRNHRVTSGLTGSTGLWRTDSAILGPNGLTRISLAGLFVAQDNFPVHGTQTTHAGARLAVDLVFLKYFEGFLSYGIASDYADEGESTRLIQTLGDFQFGVKGSSQIFDGFHLGGALHFGLAPGFGADWTSGVSFDFAPRLIASWDVRALNDDIPLLLHLNLGAIFTNQDRVYDDYSPSAFDEFAFDLNRYNRLSAGLGVEIPLPWVTPFLEWNMALPITSSDLYTPTGKPVDAASAMEHRMTLGLKVTALPDLTFLIALDFGLNGEVARGIAATPNVAFAAGLSYAFDPLFRHRDSEMSELDGDRTAYLPPPPAVAVRGMSQQMPVPEDPEEEELAIPVEEDAASALLEADGVRPAPADSAPAEEVAAEPRPRLFLMAGQASRSGRITFVDGSLAPLDVPEDGFELMLEPGTYEVLIQAEGFLAKIESLSVAEGKRRIDLALTPRPAEELFAPGEVKVVIPAQPIFGDQGKELPPSSGKLLDQIADALLSGKVARLRIEGHMDNRGDAAQQLSLSEKRANAVREALIARGIDADRLVAEGKGGKRPIASNALTKGRLRNRRIELHVLSAKPLETTATPPADR